MLGWPVLSFTIFLPLFGSLIIAFIKETINSAKSIHFIDLISVFNTRLVLVVTFIAILEMLRTKQITVKQDKPFGDLVLIGESA